MTATATTVTLPDTPAEVLAAMRAGRRATALGDLARRQLAFGFDDTGADAQPTSKPPATTQIVLHAHLSADAILRPELAGGGEWLSGYVEQAGHRVLTADRIRAWCVRPDVQITVKPVIDLHQRLETTGYTPTDRIRDHVTARDRTCVFPWCGRNARRCDLDHVDPFDHIDPTRGGPTSTDNLAPLCRRHHRLKTKGRWRYQMTDPGVFAWTSPLGDEFLRDHTGSRPLGSSSPADRDVDATGQPPHQWQHRPRPR